MFGFIKSTKSHSKFSNLLENLTIFVEENNEDGRFVKAKMLEIFCKIGLKEVYRMKYKDSEEVLSILEKTFNDKPSLVRKFKLGKTQYGFHPQLDDLTFGEYIDLDTYIGDWDNIEKAMNVLYRPIITSIGEKYAIDEYNTENDKYLLDMPMSAVTSSIFFLMKLGADLSNHILKSLEKDNEEIYQQFLTLEKNGDGISQFGLYVDQTLQKLNISLN